MKTFKVMVPIGPGFAIVGEVVAESELHARVMAKVFLRNEYPRFNDCLRDMTSEEVAA